MRPGNTQAVEVWNGDWRPHNEQGLQLYYSWLNAGHRLVATAGSDLHGDPGEPWPRWGVNTVYAEDLSESAVLAALRKGHSYISSGPELLFTGRGADGAIAISGDALPVADAALEVTWSGADAGARMRFVVDGKVRDDVAAAGSGTHGWNLTANEAGWCTVELRDAQGGLHAVSNPIFFRAEATGSAADGDHDRSGVQAASGR